MGPVGHDFMYRRPEVNSVRLRRTRGGAASRENHPAPQGKIFPYEGAVVI